MVIQFNGEYLSDHTERYKDTGLSPAFLAEMVRVVDALKATGYDPFDQLTGYVRTGNELYITRHENARELVKTMDKQDINTYLKHYKEYNPDLTISLI